MGTIHLSADNKLCANVAVLLLLLSGAAQAGRCALSEIGLVPVLLIQRLDPCLHEVVVEVGCHLIPALITNSILILQPHCLSDKAKSKHQV